MKKKPLFVLATCILAPSAIMLAGCTHSHEPSSSQDYDGTHHWHSCTNECAEQLDKAAHEESLTYGKDTTKHWKICTECTGKITATEANHDFQEIEDDAFIASEGNGTTTKTTYYLSCVCGETSSETFTSALFDTSFDITRTYKTFDGTAIAPVVTTNSTATPTIMYKVRDAADTTYTSTAPINAGQYTMKVSVPETTEHKALTETKNFTIGQKTLGLQYNYIYTIGGNNTLYLELDKDDVLLSTGGNYGLVEGYEDVSFVFDFKSLDGKNGDLSWGDYGSFSTHLNSEPQILGADGANYKLESGQTRIRIFTALTLDQEVEINVTDSIDREYRFVLYLPENVTAEDLFAISYKKSDDTDAVVDAITMSPLSSGGNVLNTGTHDTSNLEVYDVNITAGYYILSIRAYEEDTLKIKAFKSATNNS